MQDPMRSLDRLRGERAAFLAASLEERSVTRGDVRSAELLQLERAQVRNDLLPDQLRVPLRGRTAEASVATSIHERR